MSGDHSGNHHPELPSDVEARVQALRPCERGITIFGRHRRLWQPTGAISARSTRRPGS